MCTQLSASGDVLCKLPLDIRITLQVRPDPNHTSSGAGHQQWTPGQPSFHAHAIPAATSLQVCSICLDLIFDAMRG